ncbi:MAG TPA: class I SAM-dependent methyltransferase [Acidimicrobiia bacterium]
MPDDHDDAPNAPADIGGLDYGRLYEFRFRDVEQRARQTVWNEIGPFVWKRMGSPARVLDPAGGRGEFVNSIAADERWLVDLVDYPHRQTVPGVKVVIGDVLTLDLPRDYFDGIFVSNLLEHLPDPDAVAGFLARMREALAPGGVLAIMGPNFKYCAREYFDCADHLLALTHVSVEEHLIAAGFEVHENVARFLPFSFRSRLPSSARLTRLYLQMPLLWRVAGSQFLLLAR